MNLSKTKLMSQNIKREKDPFQDLQIERVEQYKYLGQQNSTRKRNK